MCRAPGSGLDVSCQCEFQALIAQRMRRLLGSSQVLHVSASLNLLRTRITRTLGSSPVLHVKANLWPRYTKNCRTIGSGYSASNQCECQTSIALGNCWTCGSSNCVYRLRWRQGLSFHGFSGEKLSGVENPGGGLNTLQITTEAPTGIASTLLICSCCTLIQLSSLSRPSS